MTSRRDGLDMYERRALEHALAFLPGLEHHVRRRVANSARTARSAIRDLLRELPPEDRSEKEEGT